MEKLYLGKLKLCIAEDDSSTIYFIGWDLKILTGSSA